MTTDAQTESADTPAAQPRAKRRWYQFSLWSMFVWMTVIAVLLTAGLYWSTNWFVRDFLIVAAGTFAGAVAGTFCLLLELVGLWVVKGLSKDAPSLERPRYRAAWLIVIAVWAIACGAFTFEVVHRVHRHARASGDFRMIDSSVDDFQERFIILPIWILGLAAVAHQSFVIARMQINRFPAIVLTFLSLGMHVAVSIVLVLVLSVVAHIAAGGHFP